MTEARPVRVKPHFISRSSVMLEQGWAVHGLGYLDIDKREVCLRRAPVNTAGDCRAPREPDIQLVKTRICVAKAVERCQGVASCQQEAGPSRLPPWETSTQ